jgi:hypothetical protein
MTEFLQRLDEFLSDVSVLLMIDAAKKKIWKRKDKKSPDPELIWKDMSGEDTQKIGVDA